MTQPTVLELRQMEDADPTTRAAIEFAWAFTEWWEMIPDETMNLEGLLADARGEAMERAHERWRNLR